MPAISRIRLTNLVYENGAKRYGDEVFQFDTHNGVILLENGGGKTVFVQAVLQTILPHSPLAERKAKDTFALDNSPAHLAIEWIINERPRRYALTAVTIFASKDGIDSYKYVYEYETGDEHSLVNLPLVRESPGSGMRVASKEEMYDYYQNMNHNYLNAHLFSSIREYQEYIEQNFKIIISEWRNIARINSAEGEIEGFFEGCKTTSQLVDQLLIPVVEEALAGKGTQDFVDIFARQRDHFKKHRQLRERIEESQRVDQEINHYVEFYSTYDQAVHSFLQVKGEAKTLYQLAGKNQELVEEELLRHQEAQEILDGRYHELARKQASYELADLEQELNRAGKIYNNSRDELQTRQEDYDAQNRRLQNLEVARLKADIKKSDEEIVYYAGQLQSLEKDQDVIELEEQIRSNSGYLRFYYLEQENLLKSMLKEIEIRQQKYQEELHGLKRQYQERQAEYQELLVKRGQALKQGELADKEMISIANQLLANSKHDNLHQERRRWEQRIEELEKNRRESERDQHLQNEEKSLLSSEMPQLRQQLQTRSSDQQRLKSCLESIEVEHDTLLNRLKELRSELYSIDSLYLKQNRVMEYMTDEVETLRLKKEKSILKESQASTLFSLYEQSSYFSADPQMQQWAEDWLEQFQYLESGTIYVQRAARQLLRSEEDYFRVYPFWAITILCRDSEAERLVARISKQAGQLSHPVFVLNQEEARRLVDNLDNTPEVTSISARQIIPSSWQINLSPQAFNDWKQQLEIIATEASSARKTHEAELHRLEDIFNQIKRFLNKFPYEEYRQLRQELQETREQVLSLEQTVREREARLEEIDIRLERLQKNLREMIEEHAYLSHWVQQAQIYLRKEAEKNNARLEVQQYDELIRIKNEDMVFLEQLESGLEDKIQAAQQNLYAVQEDIKHLQREPLYKEVQNDTPLKTMASRASLELERKGLLDILYKKQSDRQSITTCLNVAHTSGEKAKNELERKILQYECNFDEDFIFPPGGDEEIYSLITHTQKLKKGLDKLTVSLRKNEKEFDLAQDRFDRKAADFYSVYQDRVLFNESLMEVKEQLAQEREELKLHHHYLEKQAANLTAEKDLIRQAIAEIERIDGKYEFLHPDIQYRDLQSGILQDFPYQRMQVIELFAQNLQEQQEHIIKHKKEMDTEKNRLEFFCQEQVRDIRLKEMVIAGLKKRDSYEQVVEWKNRLSERIARAIQHAEDDIREHDRELQQFINHLHSYLVTMAGELRIIPRKTRVKVDESWKEIFIFDVPTWDEKEGKNELRKHVDWMVNQIESLRYRDETGNENLVMLQNDIKKWLQPQQLLRNVMKENTIRVKCRKVTADGKVNSYPNTWESSNQWSGGEKWSKNMALFLGILNYLAEKRQAVDSKARRSRTVILDNPFGKASSDHVLDPVFFIAEQLGFQIIALTALAEGKFIRDYFPIVYSCRLRPTASEDKYVVVTEREIRYAYFQDHEPEAIKRLGEAKQMELF